MESPYKFIKAEKLKSLKAEYQKALETNTAATAFIKEIENGNLNAGFPPEVNQEEELTKALLAMQQQLQKMAVEEKERNWSTEGLAMFAELLRTDNDNSKIFYQKIIAKLVKYLDVNQGGLFLVDDEDENNITIEMVSCYAYNKQKHHSKRINPGEGLIGQCYLEKETIFMTDIPNNYIEIKSGLGTANPGCLVVVPLKVNEQVHGFVELAGFKPLKPFQVEFLERLGESIASTISSVKINQRTKLLLEETQVQAEQMRAQEEEMRQNMEEISATQEEMGRVSAEMEGQIAGINKAMATIEFDLSGNILNANENFLQLLDYNLPEIEGKHHRIFVEAKERQSEAYKQFWEQLSAGKGVSGDFKRLTKTGKEIYIKAVYNPIFDQGGRPKKIQKIAYDISESKLLELRLKNQLEEAHAQEEELRQNMEELSATQEEMNRVLTEVEGNEAFMRDLINASSDSILTIDKNYRIISCNRAMLESLKGSGMTVEKGSDIFTLLSEEQKPTYKDQYDRTFLGESFVVTENYSVGEYEMYYELTHSPLRNEKDEVIGAAIFSKNVTESVISKRKADELLAESQLQTEELKAQEEEMLRKVKELSAMQEEMSRLLKEVQVNERYVTELLNVSKDSIVTLDENYGIITCNKAFKTALEAKNIRVDKGYNILEIFPPEVQEEKKSIYKKVFKGEIIELVDHLSNNGFDHYYQVQHSPLRNEDGEIIAISVFARDITELSKLQQQKESRKK